MFLLSGLKPSASKYFKDSLSLLSFGSTITIFLQSLTFDRINPQSNPIAPAPMIKALTSFMDLISSFSPSSTACKATAHGSAIGASCIFRFLGSSYIGSWVNFGAGSTNSNLNNNYGNV